MDHHPSDSSSSHQLRNPDQDSTLDDADPDAFQDQEETQVGGAGRVYLPQPDVSFATLAEAKRQLADGIAGSKWRYYNKSSTADCEKIWYRCYQKDCPVRLQLNVTKPLSVFVSDQRHRHGEVDPAKLGISSPVKAKIIEYDRLKLKPKAILVQLRKDGLKQPTTSQLNNFLSYHRGKTLGTTGVTLHQLQQWANERSEVPDDDDEVFCGKFECVALPSQLTSLPMPLTS